MIQLFSQFFRNTSKMFLLLFILLQYNLSECWKHDYLLFLSGAGEDYQEGEMTPVNNSVEGSDYALGRDLKTNPLDCRVKKKTTVKRTGLEYMMRCSSSHSFDKCEFRKIELTAIIAWRIWQWLTELCPPCHWWWLPCNSISELSGTQQGKLSRWRRRWIRMTGELSVSVR